MRQLCPALVLAVVILFARQAIGQITLTTEQIGTFASPTFAVARPADARLYVCERNGYIRIVTDGAVLPTPYLSIPDLVDPFIEGGLLGLAFHPEYDDNGRLYINYTRTGPDGLITVVAEYQVSDSDPNVADRNSARVLLEVEQPAANHNGGWIGFGPNDGYLYVAMGDGGFEGSGPERAQTLANQLLGKMLRIDVNNDDFPKDETRNYAIPPDNPFVHLPGDDEIWAYGLRNPYRCGFDRETGDLWISDVGDFQWEEINFQPANSPGGENYGWGCMEGAHCNGNFCACFDPEIVLPVHEYSHTFGCAVVGGVVYRGCAMPDLQGTYFYGDFCSGRIWTLRYENGSIIDLVERTAELGAQHNLAAITEDHLGEICLVTLAGDVRRVIPETPIPDTCTIPGDFDGDGDVTTADLLMLLADWGPCNDCVTDLNGDGVVSTADLLELLANWYLY